MPRPCVVPKQSKTWMAGTSPAMTARGVEASPSLRVMPALVAGIHVLTFSPCPFDRHREVPRIAGPRTMSGPVRATSPFEGHAAHGHLTVTWTKGIDWRPA
jgi:hypothetical protein